MKVIKAHVTILLKLVIFCRELYVIDFLLQTKCLINLKYYISLYIVADGYIFPAIVLLF